VIEKEKFKKKYRIPSARLQNWDYRWNGHYFITICTQNRETYFGEIENGKMELHSVGVIADILWHEIKNHAKNVRLDEFVVMPNHIHGVLILNNDVVNKNINVMNDNINVETGHAVAVETGHALSLRQRQPSERGNEPEPRTIGQQRFRNIGKNSISSIIGSYKSAVTKHAHRLGYDIAWQTRFYDHIIRDEKSYKNIQNYIIDNPIKWNEDKFNPEKQINMNGKFDETRRQRKNVGIVWGKYE